MTATEIVASGLTKAYPLFASNWERVRELVVPGRRGVRRLLALDDVSFTLPQGQGLGLIGENGAGKSTLLKIVAGVTAPTSGSLQLSGRVTSILELGSGFHPDFSGRRNIRLNAALLGLSEAETREREPEIIEFAELGEFIDRPVRTYSTGMAMRLGFAIATAVEPDVLIIDEALSVGDGYFQKKCMDRLLAFVSGGGTLLFCSHAMYYISAFCREAVWLRDGRVAAAGETSEVVRAYEEYLARRSAATPAVKSREEGAPLAGPARLISVRLTPDRGERPLYRTDEAMAIEIEWTCDDPELEFQLGVGINRTDEVEVLSFGSHLDGVPAWTGERRYRAELTLPRLPLVKGEFVLYVFLLDAAGLHVFDRRIVRPAFAVDGGRYHFGLVQAEHRWRAGH